MDEKEKIDASQYKFTVNNANADYSEKVDDTEIGKIDVNQSLEEKGIAIIAHVDCDDNALIIKGIKDGFDVRIPKKEFIKAMAKLM